MSNKKLREIFNAIEGLALEGESLLGAEDDIPIPADELYFKDGNLWKPKSERDGNLVVLIRGDWPQPVFAAVVRRDGTLETMEYTGKDNPYNGIDRYHYRTFSPGKSYAGERRGGGVRLYYGDDYVFIPIPGPPGQRHESYGLLAAPARSFETA